MGPMGLQDLVRWLLPKEEHFYDFLERQAVAAHEGASALARFKDEGSTAELVAKNVQAVEPQGALMRTARGLGICFGD